MIRFEQYPHINEIGDESISRIMENGVSTEKDAIGLSQFVWKMVEKINEDEEKGIRWI